MRADQLLINSSRTIASALMVLATPAMAQTSQSEPTPAPATSQVAPSVASPDGFAVGVDTIQTVEAKLGKPLSVMSNSDGTTTAIYTTTKTHVKGASFIPVAGLFAGGAKGHIATKIFFFDAKGTLKSFSSSETNVDCHSGLSVSCH